MTWVRQTQGQVAAGVIGLPGATAGVSKRRMTINTVNGTFQIHGSSSAGQLRAIIDFVGQQEFGNTGMQSVQWFIDRGWQVGGGWAVTREAVAGNNAFALNWEATGQGAGPFAFTPGASSWALDEWMPEPAQTNIAWVDNVTSAGAALHAHQAPNTGRPTHTRHWRVNSANGWDSGVVLAHSTGNVTAQHWPSGLAGNTRYWAFVMNQNATGHSHASAGHEFLTLPAADAIAADQITWNSARIVAAHPSGDGTITARVWQLAAGLNSTTPVHEQTTGNVTSATFTGLHSNQRYRARVINRNAQGDGNPSNWFDFDTLPAERAWIRGQQINRLFSGGTEVNSIWSQGQRIWNRG